MKHLNPTPSRLVGLLAGLAFQTAAVLAPLSAQAHEDTAYWHDSGAAAHNPQWMLTIGPDKKLTDLSLPGSHDSGTYLGVGGDTTQTQTMTIRQQLDSGIRYLDIRLKHFDLAAMRNCNDSHSSSSCSLQVFHNFVPQMVAFETDVLQPTLAFLRANPSETVVMRVAKELADCDCDPGKVLEDMLKKTVAFGGSSTPQAYADFLLPATCPDPRNLRMGPVLPAGTRPDPASCSPRGKLLLMPQYLKDPLTSRHYYRLYGNIDFVSPTFDTLRTVTDLYDRLWIPVKNQLYATRSATSASPNFYFTAIGGAVGSFPYFFASGHSNPATGAPRLSTGLVQGISADASTWPDFPRTNCAGSWCTISYEGMNTLVADYLSQPAFRRTESRVGIVSADFPGARFITAVAGVNHGTSFNRALFAYQLRTANGQAYVPGAWTNNAVSISPLCGMPVNCTGGPNTVATDAPAGVDYAMSSFGGAVSLRTIPIRIDQVAPTVVAAASTAPSANGWYRNDVVVRYSCSDTGGSGVDQCPPDETFSAEGISSNRTVYALDRAGNKSAAANLVTVKIDKTPPRVEYRGNTGKYAYGQTIAISCVASDGRSGIASTTCADINRPATDFAPGVYTYTANATDNAGNTATATTTFTIVATPAN